MTWNLFDINHDRAAEIMRKHGFVPLGEQHQSEIEKAKAEALNREPTPYTDTPFDLKIERLDNLRRRLALKGEHYSG